MYEADTGQIVPESRPRSGVHTAEYERVKRNLSSITSALQSNPSASQSLRQKFKEKGWLSHTVNSNEEELVSHALGRIELDPNQYGKFIAMLSDVTGMDLIVNRLTGSAFMQDEGSEFHEATTSQQQPHGAVCSWATGTYTTEEPVCHEETTMTLGAAKTPVHSSSGRISDTAHQQERKHDKDSPNLFTVGSSVESAEVENEEEGQFHLQHSYSCTSQLEVTRQSQSEKDLAMAYQRVYESTESVVRVHTTELNKQIEELKKQLIDLRQQLKEERNQREMLQQKNEQLIDELTCYQQTVKEKEEAVNKELHDKTRQLEECQRLLLQKGKEKELVMLECEEKCQKLKEDISNKQNEIVSIKKDNENHMLKLHIRLVETEKSLAQKETDILTKEVEIANQKTEIERLKRERENDIYKAEIQKLKEEIRKLNLGALGQD